MIQFEMDDISVCAWKTIESIALTFKKTPREMIQKKGQETRV